ncbi:RNA-binding transcriptional accessory protein [Siculibacillus lacustris]|uniref:Small ribosomal subunit protein bS1 n=1 Tax=Siculibacillus lacustris TaxID=1549641 RepID=A0A4Q9VTI8_9HYPH|nr:Tex family protein [Siculibacillus lacustris]TBW39260.1 RNA-binding transcriptional accessory protein [Siculibacillus lacustris]
MTVALDPTVVQRIAGTIAAEIGCRPAQVTATVAMLDEGATVPFVARYRKEATGGLDDTQLRTLEERLGYLRELETRRAAVAAQIAAQGKLDDALALRLATATTKAEIEDLYLPFKPKRRTRAEIAREKGLGPLAEKIFTDRTVDPKTLAAGFVGEAVADVKTALDGARDILTEQFAENADLVGRLRAHMTTRARIRAKVIDGKQAAGEKFADYFDHVERLAEVPSHRALAMLRGRNEEILGLELEVDADVAEPIKPVERIIAEAFGIALPTANREPGAADRWLFDVARWCWRVKLSLSLSVELMGTLRERSEEEAIRVFAHNLKDLLLAAPAGARTTLGLDPGIRTGVKVAVVDATSKVVATTTVYPFPPRNDVAGTIAELKQLIVRHKVELVAIGNGTGSRETDRLVAALIAEMAPPKPIKVTVSEAGASVYSASALAAAEMPGLDVSLRGAVSIARRLQDPLAELVKIDPKSIGVGQYQHDVDQARLAKALDAVVEDAVNAVGVDLNTASAPLLARVSGLGASLAEAIVAHREAAGRFRSRRQLLEVARLGPKTFELAAGFLRIRDGDEPLDASSVHPEAYSLAKRIVAACGRDLRTVMGDGALLKGLDPRAFVDPTFGLPTVKDILAELEKPGRDPRPSFKTARFAEGVEKLSDLTPGMTLEGTVTNVAAFGAFVDIGVHQDGLVHVSQLADRFVKDPREVVKAGDVVTVRVVEVDVARKRIALSMRRDDGSPERAPRNAGAPAGGDSRGRSGGPSRQPPAATPAAPGALGAALLDALRGKR